MTSAPTGTPVPALEMRGISKRFPGVLALDRVDLKVMPGEIHAIVGENGAGKSTLMKVLSGVYPHGSHEGDILVQGQVQRFRDIRDSEAQGIIIIHQELALVPLLSITENLFLGHEPGRWGLVDWDEAHQRASGLLQRVGLPASPFTAVGKLGMGQQQLVEIAKALAKKVRTLILDEPTASLNETDSQALLQLLLELKGQGVACILISHKLNEILKVADQITVLRDGRTIETLDGADPLLSEDRIIQGMVGREMAQRYPTRQPNTGEVIFEVRNWRVHDELNPERQVIKGVDLQVRSDEIVGIAGLMGSGRTELAMSLFGRSFGQRISGEVRIQGQPADVSTVHKAIAHGMAYVTEDRKGSGLVLDMPIRENITLSNLTGVSRLGVLQEGRETEVAKQYRDAMQIRCAGIGQSVVHLSGGNQQKVVLSKWLFTQPRLLILDEPTRGIDVGAKFEIYTLITQMASRGEGVLLISSEMPELLGLCDRIYVMSEGHFVAEFTREQASQERIMRAIVNAESPRSAEPAA